MLLRFQQKQIERKQQIESSFFLEVGSSLEIISKFSSIFSQMLTYSHCGHEYYNDLELLLMQQNQADVFIQQVALILKTRDRSTCLNLQWMFSSYPQRQNFTFRLKCIYNVHTSNICLKIPWEVAEKLQLILRFDIRPLILARSASLFKLVGCSESAFKHSKHMFS